MKTTNGVVTKYVYGKGLIGEEVSGAFKTYHFDFRGSTIALTDASGNIIDTFAYDTYGKLISRTGTSKVIFCYNGRDGVVTDDNGLIYMRARFYSPEMKRFINADIIAGEISNTITLNRFAYANGNPVSNIDPFGLATITERSEGEEDIDPTDDYEHFGIGGGGAGGGSYNSGSTNSGVAVQDSGSTQITNQTTYNSSNIASARRSAVEKAWIIETNNVKNGTSNYNWTPSQRNEILITGKVKGYEGHHVVSVSYDPSMAGDPSNIIFLTRNDHFYQHYNNWRTPTNSIRPTFDH